MNATRYEYKKIRRQKSFEPIIGSMLEAQDYRCNMCLGELYEYEKVPYTHPAYLYDKGMPLYGMARYEVLRHSIFEVDHIVPISKGGTNSPSNLQILCRHCNSIKGSSIC